MYLFSPIKLSTLVILLVLATGPASAAPPSITKVEPPGWWVNHTMNPVRLLVRGTNLQGARVTSAQAGIKPGGALVNSRGTYIFISVNIDPDARTGIYPLVVETDAGKTVFDFRLEQQLDAARNFQGVNADDCIYLIMPDRFANGDPSNDIPPGAPAEATDRRNPRAYHGGDLRGIIDRLEYIKDLGVTAIWLNPWYDNWNGVNQCDRPWCPNTYYHGYHSIDYYSVEDRFGDLELLRLLVEKAHSLNLKVIQDQVANHVGSRHPWVADPPLNNWFNGTQSSHVQNPFRHDLLLSPYASEVERRLTLEGWFAQDLPDLNQNEPEVARYLIQNSLWWVGMTGIDGIRQDTAQYMPRAFLRQLSDALHRQYPRMWMVGEVFDRDPVHTSFFIGGRVGWDGVDTGLDSVFDFPLWQTSVDVFTGKKPVRALRDMLKYDVLYSDPGKLTTIVSNHDVARFRSVKGGSVEGLKLHLAFTLTTRGIPQLYYGDEIGMEGGEDPDNRRDFPGGFPGDKHSAFHKIGRSAVEQEIHEWTRYWIRLRRDQPALRRGEVTDLFFDDEVYAFSRRVPGETVVIAINRSGVERAITLRSAAVDAAEGSQLRRLGSEEAVTIRGDEIVLKVPGGSAVAYRLAGAA